MIPTVTVPAFMDSTFVNPTQDQVFLLSESEVNNCLPTDSQRLCKGTSYALSRNLFSSGGNAYWMLRGRTDIHGQNMIVPSVFNDGEIGYCSSKSMNGLRPALWIDLRKIK